MKIRTYSELVRLATFEERLRYLKLDSSVGVDTFGFDRYMNQLFYKSGEWKSIRNQVIVRDNGCNLGIVGRDIGQRIYVHHMNPIAKDDIELSTDFLLNPQYLICTDHMTHNAIHYGTDILRPVQVVERSPWDMCPWRN